MLANIILLFAAALQGAAQNIPNGGTDPVSATPSSVSFPVYGINTGGSEFNYIRTWTPQAPVTAITANNTGYSRIGTAYRNGFGTVYQSIKQSVMGNSHIVTPVDIKPGLTSYGFLPYISDQKKFRLQPFAEQKTYYNSSWNSDKVEKDYTYSKQKLEANSGVLYTKSYAPGVSFVGSNRGTTSFANFNSAGADNDIPIINLIGDLTTGGKPKKVGTYPAGQLTVKHTTGEHNSYVKEYYNKNDQLLCKKVKNATEWLATYYVYDDLGRLVWLITPDCEFNIHTGEMHDLELAGKCFHYNYDEQGRVRERKVPDRDGYEYTVYDPLNRPVMFQSPELREQGKWAFTIYDGRGNVVMSGLIESTRQRSQWQSITDGSTTLFSGSFSDKIRNGFDGNYTFTPDGGENIEVLVYNYYDEHSKMPVDMQLRTPENFASDFVTSTKSVYPEVLQIHNYGKLVGSRVKVMDGLNSWIRSVFFYDQFGRAVQTHTSNPDVPATDDWDVAAVQFDFSGNKLVDITRHVNPTGIGPAYVKVVNRYHYNHEGQMVEHVSNTNNTAWLPMATYKYDDMGRLTEKTLGGIEDQSFTYTIRNELKSINKDYVLSPNSSMARMNYGEVLCYDYGFAQRRYDGKLAGYMYRGAGLAAPARAYGYNYDEAGRMTLGYFSQREPYGPSYPINPWSTSPYNDGYSAYGISYDKNGNMQTMSQNGIMLFQGGNPIVQPIDELTYNYYSNSNRLSHVQDLTNMRAFNDFEDNNTEGYDYEYDKNGNLQRDYNKHINEITYNHLDLPLVIIADTGMIENIYDANGVLLRKEINSDNAQLTSYKYWGPFVYRNDSLLYMLHEHGRTRVVVDSNKYYNDFFVKDHLGNVRGVIAQEIVQGLTKYNGSFELAAANVEEGIFEGISQIRAHSPLGTPSDLMSGRLNGSEQDHRIGAAVLLHAMAGDAFELSGYGYYESDENINTYAPAEDMLSSLIATLSGGVIGTGELEGGGSTTQIINNLFTTANYNTYEQLKTAATDPAYPRAYLNYLVFDENLSLIPEYSRVVQLRTASGAWQLMNLPAGDMTMPINGYVGIHYSNESDVDVYIDNLHTIHYKGKLLEEQHYYPHGLTIAGGGQNTTPLVNKYLYQTKNLQSELGMELYDFHARQYDPQIGRFWGVDPADQYPSGYTGMGNDPAGMIDPTGMLAAGAGTYSGRADEDLTIVYNDSYMSGVKMAWDFKTGYVVGGQLESDDQREEVSNAADVGRTVNGSIEIGKVKRINFPGTTDDAQLSGSEANERLHLSERGYEMLANYENPNMSGFRNGRFYIEDVGDGVRTIGFGYVVQSDQEAKALANGITIGEAVALMRGKVEGFETKVKAVIDVPLYQHQFDALVIFTYQSGSTYSGLANAINGNVSMSLLRNVWLSYDRSGGKSWPGIRNRRTDEFELYINADYKRDH
ncbi:glycoside hydrolase family protein [Pedobacter sp. UBA4863]|nr:RHS repeat-associated core domain-containing protein [Pedobacter sp. UBA4863]